VEEDYRQADERLADLLACRATPEDHDALRDGLAAVGIHASETAPVSEVVDGETLLMGRSLRGRRDG
jgi:hypothetical protein